MALSTSFQRLSIRCELREQNYPTDRVTVLHRDLFAAVGIAWREGNELDAELSALTKQQATSLISHLKGTA